MTRTMQIALYNGDDDSTTVHVLPATWEICPRCRGEGTHLNPSIDGHGITQEEWDRDWGDEERDNYFNGVYDVVCEQGCTSGKVLVGDEARMSAAQRELYVRWLEEEAERKAEEAADRRTQWYEDGCPR
jgi:hypothetical protein